jgi:hypothetical protein
MPAATVTTTASVVVQVAVHVIRTGTTVAEGNVPRKRIRRQIAVLNNSFGGATGGAATSFSFALRSIDRTTNTSWFTAANGSAEEKAMKKALRVPSSNVLNLYTAWPSDPVNGEVLGTSAFPWEIQLHPVDDGVVVRYTTLPGGGEPSYGKGDTAVHETGHWLGLLHTFEGLDCSGPGDLVDDTPAEASASYDCQLDRDTCTASDGTDPVTNFMDYGNDACMSVFTAGQSARMDTMWAYRSPSA